MYVVDIVPHPMLYLELGWGTLVGVLRNKGVRGAPVTVFLQTGSNWRNAMPYVPVPNVAQLEFTYVWQAQRCQNVLHYFNEVNWTPELLLGLANAAVVEWNTNVKPRCVGALALVEVKATDLESQTGPVAFANTGLPITGTLSGVSVPNNVTVAITKRTASRGRSFRGRIFHPGLAQTDITSNTIVGGALTAILAAWTPLMTISDGVNPCEMVVVSRFQNGAPLGTGESTVVTGLTSDGVVDSQRRRLPGRGN